jgi:prolipoprotein diacylglyceryltransferase
MIAYAITRFLIEQLRGDEAAFVGGLTISQAVSVGILAAGVVFWLWLRSRPAALYVRSPEAAAATGA